MTITLTPEMEHLVQSKVQSGLFGSPADVVYEGLLLLDQEEARLEELKSEIAVGIEQTANPLPAPAFPAPAKCRAETWGDAVSGRSGFHCRGLWVITTASAFSALE